VKAEAVKHHPRPEAKERGADERLALDQEKKRRQGKPGQKIQIEPGENENQHPPA